MTGIHFISSRMNSATFRRIDAVCSRALRQPNDEEMKQYKYKVFLLFEIFDANSYFRSVYTKLTLSTSGFLLINNLPIVTVVQLITAWRCLCIKHGAIRRCIILCTHLRPVKPHLVLNLLTLLLWHSSKFYSWNNTRKRKISENHVKTNWLTEKLRQIMNH